MGLLYQTTLERVRLRGARVEATVARLRLSHLLASASLQPPEMPPSALLLVRAMNDPLPGQITRAFIPGSLASAAWERAAQDRLAEFYGSAARPMWEPASSSSAAVLFSDYGEMLACLARDLASGTALGWWWPMLLRGHLRLLPGSWAAAWEKQPLYIPAALDYLDRRRQAVNVLERIAPVQAWNLLKAVLSAFDLAGLAPARSAGAGGTFEPKPHTAGREAQAGNAPVNLTSQTEERLDPHLRALADTGFPWEPHISPASVPLEMGYERQALLGVGLLLRRAPQAAFSTAFALRFRAWVGEEEAKLHARAGVSSAADSFPPDFLSRSAPSRSIPGKNSPSPWRSRLAAEDTIPAPASPANAAPGRAEDREGARREKGLASALRPSAPAEGVIPSTAGENCDPAVEEHGPAPSAHSLTRPEDMLAERPVPSPPSAQWRDSALVKTVSQSARPPQSHQERMEVAPNEPVPLISARQWEGGAQTSAGGILYLIHLLRQAELLREFETGLSGWALLELVARCLLDDAPNLADDTIWAALAHLDDRDPRTPPGLNFNPQHTYEAPASWLAGTTDQARFVRFRSRGVEIWNAEGFLVFDSEHNVPPSAGLRGLRSWRRRKLRRAAKVRPLSLSLSPELRRFLHFVLPYARWRLDRALGGVRRSGEFTSPQGGVKPPLQDALRRAGRLYLTSTHVDLVMPMSEISLPVRLAGLDANPGWVPELGRVVTFHFV